MYSSVYTHIQAVHWGICVYVQLLDPMSLGEVYQPAALYEEALSLVHEDKVAYRTLR